MKKDLVGRWAWESGFVKIAQDFPERDAPSCAILQSEKTLKKTLDNFRRKPYNYTCQKTTSPAGADSIKPSRAHIEK